MSEKSTVAVRRMSIRRDLQQVLDMQEDTYSTNFPGFHCSARFIHEFEQLLRFADRSRVEGLYVAELPGRGIVGFLWVSALWLEHEAVQDVVLVKDISVVPEARGQGVGRRLMEEAEAFAQVHGAERVTLQVTASNEPAVALYRSLGYEVDRYYMSKATDVPDGEAG
jgi:ribosomal protein S18 acetylase RimI-like enzyme